MKALVLNCGSSSIKYQLVDMSDESVLMKGLYERIGTKEAVLTVKSGEMKQVLEIDTPDHTKGIEVVFKELVDPKYGVLESLDELHVIGHRVVHGGERFSESVIVDEEVKSEIEKVIPLSPLHNPAALAGIVACEKLAPAITNVVVFDTAFHQTMPEVAYIYNIPYEMYEKHKIRKYGFHGTSHRYISGRIIEELGVENARRIITCHIGQGASICAVKDGKSIDTSMGLSPLGGIPMGSRSGNLDPSIIPYLCKVEGIKIEEMSDLLNKKSGAYGLSGVSTDFRDIEKAASEGNKRAQLALNSNHYLTAQTIAGYMATLGGADVIAFAGGVGENGKETRKAICEHLKFAGVEIDDELNNVRGEERKISTENSKVQVWIVPTNEEIVIARDAKRLLEEKENN